MHLVGLVIFGRPIAAAFLSDDVHDHRTAESAGTAQRGLDGLFVMTVDRPDVFQPEIGEQQLR